MQMPPLTCDEYDPLDAHLDELEEPGTNFLQDFIVAPQVTQSNTLVRHLNGNAFKGSDDSVDEQEDQDISFLQTASTSELVDVVGDLSTQDLTTVVCYNQEQKFADKVTKGKTSKYRGVTQTSKTSWGAKYNAKRITNTCKTPEEAAHVYDEYLKLNYPQKFSKFANFCHKCGKFVNPLGLPQFQSECECSATSLTEFPLSELILVSPKKKVSYRQQITTPTATPSVVPQTALSPAGGPSTLNMVGTSSYSLDLDPADDANTTFLSHRSSNLSVSSFKLSFLEDTEPFFTESFNDVTKLSLNRDGAASVDKQHQQLDQKHNSLPMAVISSARDSFTTQEDEYLDQIIKDIDCFSSSEASLKGNSAEECTVNDSVGGFTTTESSGGSEKMSAFNNYGTVLVEPTTLDSLEFDVGELDELARYFLSENDAAVVVQREMQANPVLTRQNYVAMGAQDSRLKKIHSLDFDSDNTMAGSSRSSIIMSDVKFEDTETMSPFLMATPLSADSSLMMPATIDIKTQFLEKYWRNDRKNIQCFPYCPEHGDYYRVRIENLLHRCKGVCRAPVKAHVTISAPVCASVAQPGLLVLARCNSIYSRKMALTEQQSLSLAEMKSLQSVSVIGVINHFGPLDNGIGGVQFGVTFHPDVWKFEFDLPKKRRYVQSSSSAVSSCGTDGDAGGDLAAEFLYFFEIDVFYSRDKTTFKRLGHTESLNFQIGNTRTLLRQRNKMVGEFHSNGEPQTHSGQNDSDKLVNADELPEKKKVKVYLGQREILSGTSLGDDGTLSGREDRELAGGKLSNSDITDEGILSSSKQSLLKDKTIPIDVDEVNSGVWKDVGDDSNDMQQATYDYRCYVSPKQKSGNIETADSWVATALFVKPNTNASRAIRTSSLTTESYSLHKLLCYAFECVLLSVLFIPVGVLMLLGFLVIPPAAVSIVCALDSLSDMELSRANSSCILRDQRLVLDRLVEEDMDAAGKSKGGVFRYHGKSEVWGRILYFSGAKFVVSMVSLIPAFVLALLAGFLYPIRPASAAIADAACNCVLWSREYTRETTGKRLADVTELDDMGGLV